jgi:high affinity Mn2+ porin
MIDRRGGHRKRDFARTSGIFDAGGTGILAGDGALNYGWEKIIEIYCDFQIWKGIHGTLDIKYIENSAFNRDRGPVTVFGARVHWEF